MKKRIVRLVLGRLSWTAVVAAKAEPLALCGGNFWGIVMSAAPQTYAKFGYGQSVLGLMAGRAVLDSK